MCRLEKRKLFKKFEYDCAEKQWNKWLQSAGGISKNLGKFIKIMKCDPPQNITLVKPDGLLAITQADVISELERDSVS